MALTDEQLAILRFARVRWKHDGLRDEAIREQFEITPTRYFQRLNQLIDNPESYVFDPQLVKRLRRLREQHQYARSAKRLAG